VGWITLPRNLLEQQFHDLGLERNFETGIEDTGENVERLNDYPDYHMHPEDDLGPEYAGPAPPLRHRERGSHPLTKPSKS
jgi:hypothetical protein